MLTLQPQRNPVAIEPDDLCDHAGAFLRPFLRREPGRVRGDSRKVLDVVRSSGPEYRGLASFISYSSCPKRSRARAATLVWSLPLRTRDGQRLLAALSNRSRAGPRTRGSGWPYAGR
jgi:hypothetical protein